MRRLAIIILIALVASTEAMFGVYLGDIIDSISNHSNSFISNTMIALLIVVLNCIFSILVKNGIYKDASSKCKQIKDKIFLRELKKDSSEDIDIANFTSKIDLIYDNYFLNKWLIIENILILVFATMAVISISWIMFVVVIVVSFMPMVVPTLMKNLVQQASTNYGNGSTRYVQYIEDVLNGRLEILKHSVVTFFTNTHDKNNDEFENKRFKFRFINSVGRMVAGTVGHSTFTIIFLVGGILVFKNVITIGGLITIIQLMNNIVAPVVAIAGYKNEMNGCKPLLEELTSDLSHTEEGISIWDVKKDSSDILVAKNIIYQYPNTTETILDNFTYTFEKGKKYLVHGYSGSGKTTLAKLLAGQLSPDQGEIILYGKTISTIGEDQILKLVSYVDQQSYIFKDTLFNNIDFYRGFSEETVQQLMSILCLDNLELNKEISNESGLSGGQKSRVCLARTLIHLPDILIVDEPTAALDYENSLALISFLCSLSSTVIVISHQIDQEIISKFNKIIHIK